MIEKVRENVRKYEGKNGTVYIHMITVEGDPEEWEYHSLKPECNKFTPKTTADFTTEIKQNGNYTNRKIVPLNTQGFTGRKGVKNDDVITALSSVSTAANFLNGTTGEKGKLMTLAEEIFTWAKSKQKNDGR